MLYSNNTLCLNCAFVAANCVVADETANMVFGICDDDDDDARLAFKKKTGEFSRKKNEDFVWGSIMGKTEGLMFCKISNLG